MPKPKRFMDRKGKKSPLMPFATIGDAVQDIADQYDQPDSVVNPLHAAMLFTTLPRPTDEDEPPLSVLQPVYGEPSRQPIIIDDQGKPTQVIDMIENNKGELVSSEGIGQNSGFAENRERRYKPTDWARHRVLHLSGMSIPTRAIAYELGISEPTLFRHFQTELNEGRDFIDNAVTSVFMRKVMEGDTACMIFYLKARRGWSEKQIIVNQDESGGEDEFKLLHDNMRRAQLNKGKQAEPTHKPEAKQVEHKKAGTASNVITTPTPAPRKFE